VLLDFIGDRLRLAGLSDCERTSPLREHRQRNTGKHETGEDRDWKDVFRYFLMATGIGKSKHNMLDLVVYTTTCLEGVGLRV
jgi:hypothetical protein